MKKLLISIACMSSFIASAQDKLRIEVNKNMELLGLMYTIVYENPNNVRYDTTDTNWEYGQLLIDNYGHFGDNEKLNQLLPLIDHLWISDFFSLMTSVDDFPNAHFSESISNESIIHFSEKKDPIEAREIVNNLLEFMNEFHKIISFDTYLEKYQNFYQKAIEEMEIALRKDASLETLEKFYQFSYEEYWAFPSLTIPSSMGFSTNHDQEAFALISAQNQQNLSLPGMGFSETNVSDLYIHEIGHALLWPAFSKIPDSIFNTTSSAFSIIEESMYHQNYLTWKGVLNEFFTRSGEVIVKKIMNDSIGETKLFNYHTNDKGFVYLPLFIDALWSNYNEGETYFNGMIATLKRLSQDHHQYSKSNSSNESEKIVEGKISNLETGSPIPFVHVGLKGKNIGTISKEDGSFKIKLEGYDESVDSLFFSSIGYKPHRLAISNLDDSPFDVFLSEEVNTLAEIVVLGKQVKEIAKYGRKKTLKRTRGQSNSTSYGTGEEYGIRINIEDDSYLIKDINFHMRFNTTDSILFRINIYSILDGLPYKSILKNELYMKSYKGQKWIRKDFSNQKIVIDEDVIITYETVKVYFSNKTYNNIFFTFGKGYQEGLQYMRRSSFDNWQVNEKDAFPIAMFIRARVL